MELKVLQLSKLTGPQILPHKLIMNILQLITNKIQSFITPAATYAQDGTTLDLGAGKGFENLEVITPTSFVAGAIGIALTVTIIVFFFIFVIGGYRWITSSGDEKKLAIARSQITNGLIGLLIILSSWVIMGILGLVFDINILKLTIPSFISN